VPHENCENFSVFLVHERARRVDERCMTNPISGSRGEVQPAQRELFARTREATLEAAADLFKESPDELKNDLASGKSLADMAGEKGVSSDDLMKAIKSAIKDVNPNASDDQISRLADRAVSGHHHHGHHHATASGDATAPLPPDSTISVKA
jgi:hypothetical protein